MTRRIRRFVAVEALALIAMLGLAGPALAQSSAQAGEAIGDTIRGLAIPIIFSIGALTALGAFFKRDVGLAFVTLVITIVVGGFAVAPEGIQAFTKELWSNVFPAKESASGSGAGNYDKGPGQRVDK